jgi:hypothetical protein
MADVALNCHFRPINTRHNLTDRVFQLGNLRLSMQPSSAFESMSAKAVSNADL